MTWQPITGWEVRPFTITIYDTEKLPKCPSHQVMLLSSSPALLS
ncbi:unnamed protein product [Arabidopsis thaliana]|uniref:Uncharacterized protein n=1 Tax=Arabidopsis thaliana TaxID=3702 RepID=A0A654FEW4_ARATH|nr:unnamed protein product [Arabidopsis thaliana]